MERCGDGRRFVHECDDGNNADGDGCSRDCRIEQGYTCTGGSPDEKDNCFVFQPGHVSLTQSGQVRLTHAIVINVRLDYLPQSLIQSIDCNDKCKNVLVGEIIDGDKGATSIISEYLAGSSYTFSVKVDFGRSFMGKFTVRVTVDPAIGKKYFGSVSSSHSIEIDVNPAFLSRVDDDD
jgi:cysteine-rich repeat protein